MSLHDYGERDLAKVAATAGKIAQRYRGRPGILAFDLKNEPRFNDLSLSKYAKPPPLQQRALIDALRRAVGARRAGRLPSQRRRHRDRPVVRSSDDEAWLYINNLRLYREMLADAANWVREHNFKTTTLDYLDDPAGEKWAPLLDIARCDARGLACAPDRRDSQRRSGDPITVDHVDAVLAKLHANDALDLQSLHRYPGARRARRCARPQPARAARGARTRANPSC